MPTASRRSSFGADVGSADATIDATTTSQAAQILSVSSHAGSSTMILLSRLYGLATGKMPTRG